MNITQLLTMAALSNEVEQPGLFPFPFKIHLIFCIISLLFFFYQFIKDKKYYQLIMGIAIPLSLIIHISENKTFFYAVGAVELALLIAAFIASIFDNKREKEKQATDSGNASAESDTTETPTENPEESEASESSENKDEDE